MENIELLYHLRRLINTSELGKPLHCHLREDICSYTTDQNIIVQMNLETGTKVVSKLPPYIESPKYVHYPRISGAVILANANNLVVYHPEESRFDTVFISHQHRFTAFAWNPTDTALIIANDNGELLDFTFDAGLSILTLRYQTLLNVEVPSSVYVGWGSQNTQFKGRQTLRVDPKEDIVIPYQDPVISWKENGEQFVINYWTSGRRLLKVFDSYLQPLYKSDYNINLQPAVSFKQQGNYIACAVGHNDQNKLILFEKNCLIKDEFDIPNNLGKVKTILFHPNKHFLAIHSYIENDMDYINIHVLSNAKWYLKQQLRFTTEKSVIGFSWVGTDDFEATTIKMVVATLAGFELITFRSIINRSPICALVASVDGKTAKFTFFENELIPPPLSSREFVCLTPINRIVFHPVARMVLILDTSFVMRILEFNEHDFTLNENILMDLSATYIAERNVLSFIDNCFSTKQDDFNFEADFLNNRKEGNILPINDTNGNFTPLDLELSENKNLVFCSGLSMHNIFYEFALTNTQELIINKLGVAANVTSILIFKHYLLMTQADKLFTIRLNEDLLRTPNWDLSLFYCQTIEPGIKLVTVTCNSNNIIVWVPRGNIECITSRVITLDIIENLLASSKWIDAILLIRKEKLNWNLLIDLDPKRFENNMGDFLKAVDPTGLLIMIAAEITSESCLSTMYSRCLVGAKYQICGKTGVLITFLTTLNNLNSIYYMPVIVTILSKHFSLRSALRAIFILYTHNDSYHDICQQAICRLLLYFNKKDVIAESYVLFNFEFLKIVHLWCAQDPSIYEPEIRRLKLLPEAEARFEMSCSARDFSSAIRHMLDINDINPVSISQFITKHKLYSISYVNINPTNKHFHLVSKLYGEHLAVSGKHEEAAFVYIRANMGYEALLEYKKALNWNQVLALVPILGELELQEKFLKSFVQMLIDAKKIDAAIFILTTKLNAYDLALDAYLEVKQFQNAFALAKRYDLIIDEKIKGALIEYRDTLKNKINDLELNFNKYLTRLSTVRSEKKNTYLDNDPGEHMSVESDLFSESGSTASFSHRSTLLSKESRSSTSSAKNRRKEEKKKTDLREGGYYEDIALIRQLYILIVEAFSCSKEVREISLLLVDDTHLNACKSIQLKLSLTQKAMKTAINQIWSPEFLSDASSQNLVIIHNKEHLEKKYRVPPPSEDMNEAWMPNIF